METGAEDARPAGRVGRYHLVRSLGEGGMGQVHRARAYGAAGVTKDLCVKRIRPELLRRQGAADRFIAEARLSMRLTHGNIVPVFDFGRAGEEYFLAMEWVDGADLRTLIHDAEERGEPLPADVVAHVGAEVARALAYAHGLEGPDGGAVVHRDVKPANVLVSRAGDVKLGDFGVATVVGDRPGGVGGTAGYMAPEQERGERLDGRADLYSLGVTLTEMLTGDRTAAALDACEAPEELVALVRGLRAPDRDDRPGGAREVAAALERFVARARAEGAPAPRDDLAERARRCASRGRRDAEDLAVDTSFALDGSRDDFAARMGATTVTGSVRPPSPRPTTKRAPDRRRGALAALGLVAAVVLLAGAWWMQRDAGGPALEPSDAGDAEEAQPVARAPSPPPPASTSEPPTEVAPRMGTAERAEPMPAAEQAAAPDDEARPARADRPVRRRAPRRGRPDPAAAQPAATEAPARLNLNALPWAEVRIDGRPVGTTPLFGVELAAGRHVVRFSNPHLGADHETTVTLDPGESRDLVVDLH